MSITNAGTRRKVLPPRRGASVDSLRVEATPVEITVMAMVIVVQVATTGTIMPIAATATEDIIIITEDLDAITRAARGGVDV